MRMILTANGTERLAGACDLVKEMAFDSFVKTWLSDFAGIAQDGTLWRKAFAGGLVQMALPARKEFMLETPEQQRYVASLCARRGFKYIVGWKDVRGWGLFAIQFAEWSEGNSDAPYINLR